MYALVPRHPFLSVNSKMRLPTPTAGQATLLCIVCTLCFSRLAAGSAAAGAAAQSPIDELFISDASGTVVPDTAQQGDQDPAGQGAVRTRCNADANTRSTLLGALLSLNAARADQLGQGGACLLEPRWRLTTDYSGQLDSTRNYLSRVNYS